MRIFLKTTTVCAIIKRFFPDKQRYGYGSRLSSFNVPKTFNWSSYFLANGKSFYNSSIFNFSECEKGSFSLRHNRILELEWLP